MPALTSSCDSIAILNLTVLPVYTIDTIDTICRGETYHFNGKELENGGLYKETFISSHGTDSIVNLLLIVWEPRIKTTTVHITDRQTYTWNKHDGSSIELSLSGVYDDSLDVHSDVTGCDSINRLQLIVHPTYAEYKDTAICQGKSYYWHNQICAESKDYFDTLRTITWQLLDSIYYQLHLTVNPTYSHDTIVYLCEGDFYNFNGDLINTGGYHYDTIKTNCCNCDSTFRVQIITRPSRTIPTTASICKGDAYSWHTWRTTDRTYTERGTYRDTLKTIDGKCDSIYYTLALDVRTSYDITLPPATICDNEWYNFCGIQINQPGDYDTTLVAANGCDSIVRVHLNVNPTYTADTTLILCSGGSVSFAGKVYTAGGNDRINIPTVNGCNCDSIFNVHIKEVYPFHLVENVILCEDSTIIWHEQTITGPGTYLDEHTSAQSNNLCDSTYELRVILRPTAREIINATILSTQSYSFGGKPYNTSGTYYDTLPALSGGCDSIAILNLTVLPVYNISIRDTICRGEIYHFNGKELENGGLYKDTLLSRVYGTDSIVNLTLVVHEPREKTRNVHISDQETYTWVKHDGSTEILNLTGIYEDTIYGGAATGCDSVSSLHLFVHKTYNFWETGTICDGQSYEWRGNQYTLAGDYVDPYKTETWHVDSIYHLHLIVNDTCNHDTVVYLCEGDYYDFNGTPISTGGVHLDTLKTEHNCDNTFRVQIIIRPTRTIPTVDYICQTETYRWREKDYSERGLYVDTIRTVDKLCDSIYYTLDLRIKNRPEKSMHETICEGDYYDFLGRSLNETGDYDTTIVAANGCDSIIHLHLDVNPVYDLDIYDTICEGASVQFDYIDRKTSGQYIYQGKTKAGCDSIVTLHLTVIAKQTAYYERHLCEGDFIEIDGQKITKSGTYPEQSISTRGCDSTTIWRISTHKPLRDTTYKAICEGQEYNFHGVIYRHAGTYVHEDRSIYNCDSTYVLVLTVNPTYRKDTSVILCENEYFTYNGHRYEVGGFYQDTAKTKNGCNCDSILNLTVTQYPVTVIPSQKAICHGDAYTWRGMTLSKPGIYDDTIKMNNRLCDSLIYRLTLTVNNEYVDSMATSICDNGSIIWRGHTYTKEGIYYDRLINVTTGCDSTFVLNLSIKPTYRFDESVNRCDIEPYWYNGQWLNRTGDYAIRYGTKCCDCDSIYYLHLRMTPTRLDTVRVDLCEGETYTYFGKPITQTGVYYDTINQPDIQQCLITMMDVGFHKPAVVSNVLVEDICADDSIFQMKTYYSGSRPQIYSLIFDDKARAEGFRSTINQPFDDVIFAKIPKKESGEYIRPDYYTAQLIMDNDICAGHGSDPYEVRFLVRYPSWIIEQNWNDAVALLNENYNGGYVFSKYAWYINGNKLNEDGSYIYLPQTIRLGDEIVVAPTRQGEDYEVPSCPIVIYDKTPELVSEFPVEVTTTNVRGQFQIYAQVEGQFLLYSTTGCLISKGSFHEGEHLLLSTPPTAGYYLLHLITTTHGAHTLKLISH